MIIDGHAHALAEFARKDELIAVMNLLGVDKIALCPGGSDITPEPYRPKVKESIITTNPTILFLSNYLLRRHVFTSNRDIGNATVFDLVSKLPEKIIQFYWVNFLDENYYKKMIEHYKKWNYKGLKLHQCIIPFNNDSEEMINLSDFAAKNNLPIFLHVFSSKEAKSLVQTARNNPETNYIIGHMMGLEEVIKFGKNLTNIYFDTSTYYIISKKRILKAVKHFGANHVIMGSDSPFGYSNLENIIKKVESLTISAEDKQLIMGHSLLKLLDI